MTHASRLYLDGFAHAAAAAQSALIAGELLPVAYATRYPRVSLAYLVGCAEGWGGHELLVPFAEGVRDGIAAGFGF